MGQIMFFRCVWQACLSKGKILSAPSASYVSEVRGKYFDIIFRYFYNKPRASNHDWYGAMTAVGTPVFSYRLHYPERRKLQNGRRCMFHAQAGLSDSVNQDSLPQPDLAAGNGNDNHRLVFANTDLCRTGHFRYAHSG